MPAETPPRLARFISILLPGLFLLVAPLAAAPRFFLSTINGRLEPTRRLVYKKLAGRELHLDVFEPARRSAGDRRPAFVAIHGGGWSGGDSRMMYAWARHAADLGMVGISVEYRRYRPHSADTVFVCVEDARSAIRYVRGHAAALGIDPAKIVVNGASAGGHLAVGAALFDGVDDPADKTSVSCRPDALVLFSPVIDTSAGEGPARIGARWRELSPVDHVRPGMPPTLTFQGTGDTLVPFAGVLRFHEAMLRAGNHSELVRVPGAPHTYMFKDPGLYAATLRRMDDFLRQQGFLPPVAAIR
ncbi:MAG TPA: alpha/beta hydrolase [Opitutaceae bacterium]|nr:alpha/beta hydrolase [Opitutaceae bacterium]